MWKFFLEHGNKMPDEVRRQDITDIMVVMGRYEYEAEMQAEYDKEQKKKRDQKQKRDKTRNKADGYIKMIQKGMM